MHGLPASSLHGWRLALGASGIFWVPLILAIAGAVVAGSHQIYQLMGAAAGFVVGMAVSGVIVKCIGPIDEEEGARG